MSSANLILEGKEVSPSTHVRVPLIHRRRGRDLQLNLIKGTRKDWLLAYEIDSCRRSN